MLGKEKNHWNDIDWSPSKLLSIESYAKKQNKTKKQKKTKHAKQEQSKSQQH